MGILNTIVNGIIMPQVMQDLKHQQSLSEIEAKGSQDRLTALDKYGYDIGVTQAKGTQERLTNVSEADQRLREYKKKFPLSITQGIATGISGGIASGAAKGYFTQKFRNYFSDKNNHNQQGPGSGSTVETDEAFWNRVNRDIWNAEHNQSKSQSLIPRPGQVLKQPVSIQKVLYPETFDPRRALYNKLQDSKFGFGRGVTTTTSVPGTVTIF